MAEIERHEDEGAKAFDPHLAKRLFVYLQPYRLRATVSVLLVILSSIPGARPSREYAETL